MGQTKEARFPDSTAKRNPYRSTESLLKVARRFCAREVPHLANDSRSSPVPSIIPWVPPFICMGKKWIRFCARDGPLQRSAFKRPVSVRRRDFRSRVSNYRNVSAFYDGADMFIIVPLKQGTFLYSCKCHVRIAKDPTRITGQMKRQCLMEKQISQFHKHYINFKVQILKKFANIKQGKKRISD